ncbi:MAG TPA: hypothetical protein VMC42_08665 [Methanoregulaceae archaeon]|nr:hypothetical protein [Methanoregulaceae archaeon]
MRLDFAIDLILVSYIVIACLSAGCTGATSNNPNLSQPRNNTTSMGMISTGNAPRYQDLALGETAILHKGNITLSFTIRDKTRDPVKKSVFFDLSVTNTGNSPVAELQYKLSNLYATDSRGNIYQVPTHVALIGLAPNETRSGIVEITDVPDASLPGLTFHYRFGDEEASWIIFPASVL